MLKSQPPYTWRTGSSNDEVWQSIRAAETNPAHPEKRRPQLHRVYELVLLLLIGGIVIQTLLWQRTEAQLLSLQTDFTVAHESLAAIHEQLATAQALREEAMTAPPFIETHHFRFAFDAIDAAVVAAVAVKSDADYVELSRDFGLGLPDPQRKLSVSATAKGGEWLEAPTPDLDNFELNVSPPGYVVASGSSDSVQVLRQELLVQLTRRCLAEALRGREIRAPWEVLVDNLELYFWREQITRGQGRRHPHYLANRQRAQKRSIDQALQPGSLALPINAYDEYETRNEMAHVVADPLAEYIVVTYGNEIVPPLLDGFGRHNSWDTLAPAVFGVPASKFEEQWRSYLRKNYPTD